ncbi:neurogenic locus notch homolog protein 3-like [Ylistrum balloti]|uniref:neurogenic locus notch homolog protein 3-like n=1 Tax=Ylistrum balloti TaxID=509963 RepID=UPI002905ED70|nr:neurogenic locus notch homolog protein 3-like [Ylistrum balloti]
MSFDSPSVTADTLPGGLHVLNPVSPTNGKCRTDVSFSASNTGDHQICLKASLPSITGEKRCYNLQIPSTSPALTPCERQTCQNGGLCKGDPSGSIATCSCIAGFSGQDCSIVGAHVVGHMAGNPIPPTVGSPPVITDTVVPDTVSCVVNTICHVPLIVTGDPNNPPTLTPVHNDPGSQIGQVDVPNPPHQLPGSPPGTYKGDVTVTDSNLGIHTSCVQTADITGNAAQIVCFKVNMVGSPAPGTIATPGGQQIVEPTLPDGSVIKCTKDKSCHVLIHTAPTGSNCDPRVTEKGTLSSSIDVFAPVLDNDGTCVTDISLPSNTLGDKHLCFQVAPVVSGGNAESRCYDLHVDQDPCITLPCPTSNGTCISGSGFPKCQCKPGYVGLTCNTGKYCASVTCNNGTCIIRNGSSFCICPPGKRGNNCYNDSSTPIPGSLPGPNTDPKFVDTVLPKRIVCTINEECKIQVPVAGTPVTPSNIQFGHLDSGVTPGSVVVDPSTVSTNQHLTTVGFTPFSTGDKRVCVQTKTSTQNVDEMCFIVDSKAPPAGSTAIPDLSQPQFTSPSLPDNSVVECKAGATCHIHLSATPGSSTNNCPDIVQVATGQMQNTHVFKTNPTATATKPTCQSTLTLAPTSGQKGDQHVCVKPALSSKQGNIKCFTIKVTDPNVDASTGGPCQSTHCQNGGNCDADFSGSTATAKCNCALGFKGLACDTVDPCGFIKNGQTFCLCPSGKTGDLCNNDSYFLTDGSKQIHGSPTVSSTEPVFVDTALPKTVTCFVGKTCTIPLPVSGNAVTQSNVAFGLVDPGISAETLTVHPLSGSTSLLHVPVTPTQPGTKHVCVQTKTASSNVDEICFDVNAVQPPTGIISQPLDGNKPQFTSPTLPENSVVECEVDSLCHLHLTTTTGTSSNTCPDVLQTGTTLMKNLLAFSTPSTTTSTCNTDVTILPTNSEMGDNHVCLKPTKTSGDQGKLKCITVHVVGPNAASEGGPCQSLHCQNNGTCTAKINVMPLSARCLTHVLQHPWFVKTGAFVKTSMEKRPVYVHQDGRVQLVKQPDPAFIDTTIPVTVACIVGQPCNIPLLLKGAGVTAKTSEACFTVKATKPQVGTGATLPSTKAEAAKMGRATCMCTLTSGKEVVVINKRPKATTVQLLKATGIGAGSVTGAITIAAIIYMIVGKIKGAKTSNPSPRDRTNNSDKRTQVNKPRPQPRHRR